MPISEMGIAAGFGVPEVCGIARTGGDDDVEVEFEVADIEMFTFGEPEIDEFEFVGVEMDVLEPISLTEFAAGLVVVAGVAGLNCTRFWPNEVVLNYRCR